MWRPWIKVEWAHKEQLLDGRSRSSLRRWPLPHRVRCMFVFPGYLLLTDSGIPCELIIVAFSPTGHVGSSDGYFYVSIDCATGCPNIWLNIILGCVLRVFLDEVNIWIVDWVKQIALPNGGGPHLISWGPKWNIKADLTLNKREFLLPDGLQAGTLAFSCLQTETDTLALLGHQLGSVDSTCRSWDLSASMIAWANFLK